jgi:hypothetical protein
MRAFFKSWSVGSVVASGSIGAVIALGGACTEGGAAVDPSPSTCATTAYRIDAVGLPRSGTGAAQIALDLDGDGTPDNRLGRLNATLATFYSDWRPDERLTARLTGRDVAWLVTVEHCEGEVAIDLMQGRDADGDGRFELAPAGDAAIGDDLLASYGVAELPLIGFTDPLGLAAAPGWVAARGVAVALRGQDTGPDLDQLDAVVGVGIELGDDALAPVAGFLTHHLGDSAVARALDADHDAVISVAELRASETIAALIADDVDVDGVDGVFDRVSLAFTIHARAVQTE